MECTAQGKIESIRTPGSEELGADSREDESSASSEDEAPPSERAPARSPGQHSGPVQPPSISPATLDSKVAA